MLLVITEEWLLACNTEINSGEINGLAMVTNTGKKKVHFICISLSVFISGKIYVEASNHYTKGVFFSPDGCFLCFW